MAPKIVSRTVKCFVLSNGDEIIAEIVEDIDADTATIIKYIKKPNIVIGEENSNIMYPWPLMQSKDNIYPIPEHIMTYDPDRRAIQCYLRGRNDGKPQDISNLN